MVLFFVWVLLVVLLYNMDLLMVLFFVVGLVVVLLYDDMDLLMDHWLGTFAQEMTVIVVVILDDNYVFFAAFILNLALQEGCNDTTNYTKHA